MIRLAVGDPSIRGPFASSGSPEMGGFTRPVGPMNHHER